MRGMLARIRRASGLTAIFALAACAPGEAVPPGPPPAPLAVYGSTATMEIAPVLLAARDFYPGGTQVTDGGIPNLFGETASHGGEPGFADVATHAETQALRYSVEHPGIRIILTVTEGHYRIIARRSAGIDSIADLKGKRIATLANTSAGYFLARMLEQAGLRFSDVEPVRIAPLADIAGALDRGEVDAVAIWEPHSADAAAVLGDDMIAFEGTGIYRELFNLNTTEENLADPVKRRRIVAFVRALFDAKDAIVCDPGDAQALVVDRAGFAPDQVAGAWSHLAFPMSLPDDLLDALVREEAWLAEQDGRPVRSREELARLIDPTVLAEALAQ